jgi:hypothetical protein
MYRPTLRKPKLHFDAAVQPGHITFDDGKEVRRNIPWLHYVEARWDYAEPDMIMMEIGEWLVLIRGHNLAPLFEAIEEHTLARLRAQPDLENDREHQADTFVVELRFLKPPSGGAVDKRRGQVELELDIPGQTKDE